MSTGGIRAMSVIYTVLVIAAGVSQPSLSCLVWYDHRTDYEPQFHAVLFRRTSHFRQQDMQFHECSWQAWQAEAYLARISFSSWLRPKAKPS